MTFLSCTRRLTFEAGHRVYGHESKCANLHGHSYKVEIEAVADLDSLGRVIDFSVLKERVGGWLDEHWDHGFVIWFKDAEASFALSELKTQKLYRMPYNPTAENMARHLLEDICPLVLRGLGVTVTSVLIRETENCFAVARLAEKR